MLWVMHRNSLRAGLGVLLLLLLLGVHRCCWGWPQLQWGPPAAGVLVVVVLGCPPSSLLLTTLLLLLMLLLLRLYQTCTGGADAAAGEAPLGCFQYRPDNEGVCYMQPVADINSSCAQNHVVCVCRQGRGGEASTSYNKLEKRGQTQEEHARGSKCSSQSFFAEMQRPNQQPNQSSTEYFDPPVLKQLSPPPPRASILSLLPATDQLLSTPSNGNGESRKHFQSITILA